VVNLLAVAQRSLEDDKAQDVVVIDLTKKSTISDHLLIATGTSARHLAAMAEHLVEHFKAAGLKRPMVEGKTVGDWVLVDAGDVVVHLFREEVRKLYNLEKLWGDPAVGPEVTAAAMARPLAGADLGA
jgi:ribosome-associated protein